MMKYGKIFFYEHHTALSTSYGEVYKVIVTYLT